MKKILVADLLCGAGGSSTGCQRALAELGLRMELVCLNHCGCILGEGNTFYEHVDPDAISGRNDIENCAVLTRTCWKFKTAIYDLPTIAKVKRVSDLAKGIKDPWRRRLPGACDSDMRLKVGGGVVDRRTGLPWRGSQ